MDTVHVDGVTYTKVAVIAKKFRYTNDYVGQLCRSGKVNCQFVGRSWYVSEESLLRHKDGRYADARVAEKTSNNKEYEDTTPRVAVNPRLKKIAARQLEAPTVTAHFLSRLEAGESKYYTDETELVPQPLKPVSKERIEPMIPQVLEVAEEADVVKENPVSLRISTSTKPKKLTFTDVPAVALRGQLEVEAVELDEVSEVVTPESIAALTKNEPQNNQGREEIIGLAADSMVPVRPTTPRTASHRPQIFHRDEQSALRHHSPFTPETVVVLDITPSRLPLLLSIAVVTASIFAGFFISASQVFLIDGADVSATIMFSFEALLKLL